jgi:hypothetical protein
MTPDAESKQDIAEVQVRDATGSWTAGASPTGPSRW